MKKIVGYTRENDNELTNKQHLWENFISSLGFIPLLLPMHNNRWVMDVKFLDALILTGGGDISPQIAKYEYPDRVEGVNYTRDINEMKLLKKCFERIPILGICRGSQLLFTYIAGDELTWWDSVKDIVNDGYVEMSDDLKYKVHFKWIPLIKIKPQILNNIYSIQYRPNIIGTMFHLESSVLDDKKKSFYTDFLKGE